MKLGKSAAAQTAINARQARMNTTLQPMPEPVISQARHGRPNEAVFAGGKPWSPYGGGRRYDVGGTDVKRPQAAEQDCEGNA